MHVHRSAGKREGVDVLDIDDLEHVLELGMPKFRRNLGNQPRTHSLDVGCYHVVCEDRHLLLDGRGTLPAFFDVHLERKLVVRRGNLRLRRDPDTAGQGRNAGNKEYLD